MDADEEDLDSSLFNNTAFSEEEIELFISGPSSDLLYNPFASSHLGDSGKKEGMQTGMIRNKIGRLEIS